MCVAPNSGSHHYGVAGVDGAAIGVDDNVILLSWISMSTEHAWFVRVITFVRPHICEHYWFQEKRFKSGT